ncbi:hypothetical protein [Klebsiella phage PhiKpNIH-6]|uniref:Uncharacterized protein n=1 Tax=Klebsiella phage PhiKpNIH-6 TaxID=2689112 RepID=A0A6B9LRF0_9CAUD|nr:hypothetical protein [Klebsiella phage PhiKpNIH-6]
MELILSLCAAVVLCSVYLWYGFNLYTKIWWAYGKQSQLKSILTFIGVVLGWPLIFLKCLTK